jgi:phosphatidylglycerophosphatase A
MNPVVILATWFGSGLSPKAPGTVGSITALPFAWLILHFGDKNILFIAGILISLSGWYISNAYLKRIGKEGDPKEVVIDEVAGMWVTLALLPFENMLHLFIIGFILFRAFDIIKPWPISIIDQKVKGGLGIMLDDIATAFYLVVLLHLITPLVFQVLDHV